jgi:hypothetical protein
MCRRERGLIRLARELPNQKPLLPWFAGLSSSLQTANDIHRVVASSQPVCWVEVHRSMVKAPSIAPLFPADLSLDKI